MVVLGWGNEGGKALDLLKEVVVLVLHFPLGCYYKLTAIIAYEGVEIHQWSRHLQTLKRCLLDGVQA